MKKIISFVLSVVIFTSIIPNCAFASEQEVLAQYTGSTTASYGCNPENNIYSHKGYFLEYKQIELLKQEKHLI
ncbi:MAG TPA: hypothetical protein OIM29_05405 [Oscillospiraceae bacterium]|jgi:hypothetical protein|nr:hypothetical protein [Oscillospiraceae bacterium]